MVKIKEYNGTNMPVLRCKCTFIKLELSSQVQRG